MSRKSILARTILERLLAAKPYALPQEQLATEVNGTVRPPAKADEFAAALALLTDGDAPRIVILRDEFDPTALKWTITESGEAALLR